MNRVKIYTAKEAENLIREFGFKYGMEKSDIDELIKANRDVEGIDKKTGLLNTHRFLEELGEMIGWHMRNDEGNRLTVLQGDFDHFKKFNDTYGQTKGDMMISGVAKDIIKKKAHRPLDLPARIGGEEFALGYPMKNKSDGLEIAQEINTEVKDYKIKSNEGDPIGITISLVLGHLNDERIRTPMEVIYGKKFIEVLKACADATQFGNWEVYEKSLEKFEKDTGINRALASYFVKKALDTIGHFRVDYNVEMSDPDLLETDDYKIPVRDYIGARTYMGIIDEKIKFMKKILNKRDFVETV
ncbi:MAG: diguanylate cyclase [Candidatus Aenigmarchaeota archaeon]|nr:diguanylate cyclase [Candidatus Aenigmarchaeota archaeon]